MLKWILSSGAAAVLMSLCGLTYRVGWFSEFGLRPDLFFPDSGAEVTYWSYVGALSAWVLIKEWILEHAWWVPVLAAVGALLGLAWVLIEERARAEENRSRLRSLLNKKWVAEIIAVAGTVIAVSVLPLMIVWLTAVALFAPLPAYFAGKKEAKSAIEAHRSAKRCHRLADKSQEIASCVFVIAQSKSWTAYLDGERTHVIPSDGLKADWALSTPSSSGNMQAKSQ